MKRVVYFNTLIISVMTLTLVQSGFSAEGVFSIPSIENLIEQQKHLEFIDSESGDYTTENRLELEKNMRAGFSRLETRLLALIHAGQLDQFFHEHKVLKARLYFYQSKSEIIRKFLSLLQIANLSWIASRIEKQVEGTLFKNDLPREWSLITQLPKEIESKLAHSGGQSPPGIIILESLEIFINPDSSSQLETELFLFHELVHAGLYQKNPFQREDLLARIDHEAKAWEKTFLYLDYLHNKHAATRPWLFQQIQSNTAVIGIKEWVAEVFEKNLSWNAELQ